MFNKPIVNEEEAREAIEEMMQSIFIEGYLSARFDKLIEDECDNHLSLLPEDASDEQLDDSLDEFWNNSVIYEAAVKRANDELEAMYDTFVESAKESWNAREELINTNLHLQGGEVGEA